MGIYYCVYEYIHWCMHLPKKRRLEQLIHRTLAALPAWEAPTSGQWLPAIIDGLEAIRQEAAHHFREEEMGGCLEEAVAHCPSLSGELTRAEREQQELLADLDELLDRARQLHEPTIREAHALGQELRAVVQKLRQARGEMDDFTLEFLNLTERNFM